MNEREPRKSVPRRIARGVGFSAVTLAGAEASYVVAGALTGDLPAAIAGGLGGGFLTLRELRRRFGRR